MIKKEIESLVNKIIPINDHKHREGFNFIPIINALKDKELIYVEDALIEKLQSEIRTDTLIVEVLAYMKSTKSIPVLNYSLERCEDDMAKLIIASSIFTINKDARMINIANGAFKRLENIYSIIFGLHYLGEFRHPATDGVISEYISHPNFLVSNNAKRALGEIK